MSKGVVYSRVVTNPVRDRSLNYFILNIKWDINTHNNFITKHIETIVVVKLVFGWRRPRSCKYQNSGGFLRLQAD